MTERSVDAICITSSGTLVFEVTGEAAMLLPNRLTIVVDGQEVSIDTIIPLVQEYLKH